MKTVIIHIGLHKTGSTSIQEYLHKYDDGKTIYVDLIQKNHSVPLMYIFEHFKRVSKYHTDILGRDINSLKKYINNYRSRLLNVLKRDRQNFIISGEGISIFSNSAKKNLINLTIFG